MGPPRPPRRNSTPWIVVVVLLLAAGGGVAAYLLSQEDEDGGGPRDSETAEGQEYVDALVDAAAAEENPLEGEDLRCLSAAVVDAVGVSRLQEAATPDEIRENPDDGLSDLGIQLSSEQANEVYDLGTDCGIDFREFMATVMADEGVSEDDAACIIDQLADDTLREWLVAAFSEDETAIEESNAELEAIAEDCGADLGR